MFSSSLIMRILETAINRGIDFRVIIVDSRPQQHGEIYLKEYYLSYSILFCSRS
jgi:translation initiation factor 2B subunit (eIF-2B alpha/beta/delta family)